MRKHRGKLSEPPEGDGSDLRLGSEAAKAACEGGRCRQKATVPIYGLASEASQALCEIRFRCTGWLASEVTIYGLGSEASKAHWESVKADRRRRSERARLQESVRKAQKPRGLNEPGYKTVDLSSLGALKSSEALRSERSVCRKCTTVTFCVVKSTEASRSGI